VPSSSTTRGGTPATEGSLDEDGQAPPGIHGGEGEGEEDEETTYTVKAKVFKFTTDREGAPTWSEMGVGVYLFSRFLSFPASGASTFNLFFFSHFAMSV
jgi:nucleoporin NUP2